MENVGSADVTGSLEELETGPGTESQTEASMKSHLSQARVGRALARSRHSGVD